MIVTVTRTSPISGKINQRHFEVTQEQMDEWNSPNRRKVQQIFPNLTPAQREFIMTGITEEEWEELFGSPDE